MDNKPDTKPTEQWKVNAKHDNYQKGNKWKNRDKQKDAPTNGKLSKKFIWLADSSALKGKIITAERDNLATQQKDLIEAALTYFGAINGKARQSIYELTKTDLSNFTVKKVKESAYTDNSGNVDQEKKQELEDLRKAMVKESAKKYDEYLKTLKNAFLCNHGSD